MGLGGFKERPNNTMRRKLIWRTWITQCALGYVPIGNLIGHVAELLGLSRHVVTDVVQMTKPDGCFQ